MPQGYNNVMKGRICIVPKVTSMGGVGTFMLKFSAGLAARGLEITHDLNDPACNCILVLGGRRDLIGLWHAKKRGIPIVQRLDGINWVQRRRRTSFRHYLRAEYGNWNLSMIRKHLAGRIVYQSEFARNWWEDWYGAKESPSHVVHNGVDLGIYSHNGTHNRPGDRIRMLVVEGSLGGGYDMGLENAVYLAEKLADEYRYPMELMVVGKVKPEQQAAWQAKSRIPLVWRGLVPRDQIPEIDRSAHILFSADINPACPNAVIEALACGLPVVAFDTGALSELVPSAAGRIVPYGGDPWKLEPPDIPALAEAAAEVLSDLHRLQAGARAQAEAALGLGKMVDGYLEALFPSGGD
jgi:glycosyltransferase involved in cell wall biosynthesis